MTCSACPFAFDDASEVAQNLGCLPSPFDLMKLQRDGKQNWACHEDQSKPCAGQVAYCHAESISYDKTLPLADHKEWL